MKKHFFYAVAGAVLGLSVILSGLVFCPINVAGDSVTSMHYYCQGGIGEFTSVIYWLVLGSLAAMYEIFLGNPDTASKSLFLLMSVTAAILTVGFFSLLAYLLSVFISYRRKRIQ